VVAGVVAAGGWLGWHALRGGPSSSRQTVRTCVTPSPAPTPARAADVTVAVLNATPKVGLAHQVAAALRARGFRIGRVGNTKAIIGGTAVVTYGPGGRAAALAVAEQVNGATQAPVAAGGVTLELGPAFTALAPPADATAAKARDDAAASPRPAVCTSS
jgi:hypothetical protein